MKKALPVFLILLAFLVIPKAVAAVSLDGVNQKVCTRFEEDVSRMAAIMEELRVRKGIQETRVAFEGVDTLIENGDYWVTYAAEAIAYQKAEEYSSPAKLRSALEVLKGKILRAKKEVGKALNE